MLTTNACVVACATSGARIIFSCYLPCLSHENAEIPNAVNQHCNHSMHVVVSGAGPCGLLVALQLQLAGIRCTVLERAAESQLEADVGSGYDLSPSSAEILKRVGLGHTLGADGLF